MARSSYIYMACHDDGSIMAVCTVKHEVVSYVTKNCHNFKAWGTIRRYRDNGGSDYTLLDLEKELA